MNKCNEIIIPVGKKRLRESYQDDVDDGDTEQVVVDIFKRVILSKEFQENVSYFELYDVQHGETPEEVAFKFYGSETLLLKPLIRQISSEQDSVCVRIYNNKVPSKINNFFDLKYNNFFTKHFEKIIQKLPKKIEEVIFIGAASIMQQSLFWSEKKDVIEKKEEGVI